MPQASGHLPENAPDDLGLRLKALQEGPQPLVDLFNQYAVPYHQWELCIELVHASDGVDMAYVQQLWDLYLKQVSLPGQLADFADDACFFDLCCRIICLATVNQRRLSNPPDAQHCTGTLIQGIFCFVCCRPMTLSSCWLYNDCSYLCTCLAKCQDPVVIDTMCYEGRKKCCCHWVVASFIRPQT